MAAIKIIFAFLTGLAAGSFVNMLLYRTAVGYKLKAQDSKFRAKKVRAKYSYCDYCGRTLDWYENVPVISWVIQGGQSRCCHRRLPLSYPLVELTMAGLLIVDVLVLGWSRQTGWRWLAVTMMLFSAIFDGRYKILPDFSTGLLAAAAVGLSLAGGRNAGEMLVAAASSGGLMMFLYKLTAGRGMGFGDVKLAVFMGLFLPWRQLILAYYMAFISGAVWGLGLMILGRAGRKSAIAFGPFLLSATLLAWWWGEATVKIITEKLYY